MARSGEAMESRWTGEAAYEVLGHRVASYLRIRAGVEKHSFSLYTLRFSGCSSITHEEFVSFTTQEIDDMV
jgi:hypothetical protein